MRIGVLGTGAVGTALATRAVETGDEVCMGARDAASERAAAWASGTGGGARHGTFADAAAFAELVINATKGGASLDALATVSPEDLEGKVLLDVANPLDFAPGQAPRLSVCNDDSLAERIQRAVPAARVVKAFNTMNADVMAHPELLPEPHTLLVCGDDAAAKETVIAFAERLGWSRDAVLDLGGLHAARGMEAWLLLWLPIAQATGSWHATMRVVRD